MFHLYVSFVIYFLYFYNLAHFPFPISWGLACNIIFVFLCLASSRCIARVIGFSFSSKSLRLEYGLVLQLGFLDLSSDLFFSHFSVSICFAFIRGFSSGRLDFACLTASWLVTLNPLFRSSMLGQEIFSFLLLSGWSLKTVNSLNRFCVKKKEVISNYDGWWLDDREDFEPQTTFFISVCTCRLSSYLLLEI